MNSVFVKDFFGGQDSAVLGFFKNREAAQVGMSQMKIPVGKPRLSRSLSPDETNAGANHSMPPSEDVQPFDQGLDFRVRP